MYDIIEEHWRNGNITYCIAFSKNDKEYEVHRFNGEIMRFETLAEARKMYLRMVNYPYGKLIYSKIIK